MIQPIPLFMGGPIEMAILVVAIVLLFGTKLVPMIARRAGEVANETQSATDAFEEGKEGR